MVCLLRFVSKRIRAKSIHSISFKETKKENVVKIERETQYGKFKFAMTPPLLIQDVWQSSPMRKCKISTPRGMGSFNLKHVVMFCIEKQGVRQIVEKLQSQKFALWIASLGDQRINTVDIERKAFVETRKRECPISKFHEQ